MKEAIAKHPFVLCPARILEVLLSKVPIYILWQPLHISFLEFSQIPCVWRTPSYRWKQQISYQRRYFATGSAQSLFYFEAAAGWKTNYHKLDNVPMRYSGFKSSHVLVRLVTGFHSWAQKIEFILIMIRSASYLIKTLMRYIKIRLHKSTKKYYKILKEM